MLLGLAHWESCPSHMQQHVGPGRSTAAGRLLSLGASHCASDSDNVKEGLSHKAQDQCSAPAAGVPVHLLREGPGVQHLRHSFSATEAARHKAARARLITGTGIGFSASMGPVEEQS